MLMAVWSTYIMIDLCSCSWITLNIQGHEARQRVRVVGGATIWNSATPPSLLPIRNSSLQLDCVIFFQDNECISVLRCITCVHLLSVLDGCERQLALALGKPHRPWHYNHYSIPLHTGKERKENLRKVEWKLRMSIYRKKSNSNVRGKNSIPTLRRWIEKDRSRCGALVHLTRIYDALWNSPPDASSNWLIHSGKRNIVLYCNTSAREVKVMW